MVPKLHKKGSSFKGAAAYLLHDKGRASTSERVSWTDARNLALDDPQLGWRIMAATAMDQDRLKQNAGIKATGRKSDTPVLHLTLSWHPDEKATLSREEMKLAAEGAIAALGAEDHQALIIAHNDETHPHLHILLNRVNPNDGRMLSSSKEKLNLSRWAESYEKERGRIYCEERVHNNEARDRGEYTRGVKDQHRRLFEEIRDGLKVSNDNRDFAAEVRKRQKAIDLELSKKGREQAIRQKKQWQDLKTELMQRKQHERERSTTLKSRMVDTIGEAYKKSRQALEERHRFERQNFERREASLAGRLKNTLDALQGTFRREAAPEKAAIGRLFKIVASKDARWQSLNDRQAREQKALQGQQKSKEREASARVKEITRIRILRARMEFLDKRKALVQAQQQERRTLQREWRQRHRERRLDWYDMRRKTEPKEMLKADFAKAAQGAPLSKDEKKAQIKERLLKGRDRDKGRDGR